MPLPTAPDALVTVDEFERYGGEEGCIVELVRGCLVRERGPSLISLADYFAV